MEQGQRCSQVRTHTPKLETGGLSQPWRSFQRGVKPYIRFHSSEVLHPVSQVCENHQSLFGCTQRYKRLFLKGAHKISHVLTLRAEAVIWKVLRSNPSADHEEPPRDVSGSWDSSQGLRQWWPSHLGISIYHANRMLASDIFPSCLLAH